MSLNWQPTCGLESLRLRAQILAEIRQFFAERSILEVETPLLSQATGTDPQLIPFTTEFNSLPQTLFLQTSPEFAMKRLLAAGSGSIYQIAKAFRNGESGRFHNPEFTILEWYRVGLGLFQLMDEAAELISQLFRSRQPLQHTKRITYQDLFISCTGLDPLEFSYHEYCAYANKSGLTEAITICAENHALWLDFLFSHQVQPSLTAHVLYLVYGYPACQSSLARIHRIDPRITDRFELFIGSVELGNGYYELTDAEEQSLRFDREIAARTQQGLVNVTKDLRLIDALKSGMPDCSGIAIGLDRLLMVISGCDTIDEVLSFAIHRA